MKIILTGSTGLIGSGVLKRCIAHPSITSIVALTRRPLEVKDAKLNNIIHKDFMKYEKDVIDQMKGAEACVWVLGSPTSGKEVHIDYTKTAVNMFLTSIVPQLEAGKKFRFVYTSGGLVPYLDSNALFFLGPARKMRGEMDRDVLDVEKQNPDRWESFIARPWFVVDEKPRIDYVWSNGWIFREDLAAGMVDAAINGGEPRLLDNAALRTKGQGALKMQPN